MSMTSVKFKKLIKKEPYLFGSVADHLSDSTWRTWPYIKPWWHRNTFCIKGPLYNVQRESIGHRWIVTGGSPHRPQCRALIFYLLFVINRWTNIRVAGDLRRLNVHVIVVKQSVRPVCFISTNIIYIAIHIHNLIMHVSVSWIFDKIRIHREYRFTADCSKQTNNIFCVTKCSVDQNLRNLNW